ncbi:unnamed protein product, partial [Phaeothamnion confervicola]
FGDAVLFDASGIRWDTVFAGTGDAAASFLVSALVSEMGIEGPAAQLLTTVGTQAVTTIASNIAAGQNAFQGMGQVGWNALALVGQYAIGEFTNSLIKNEGGAIGSQIGGFVGSLIGRYYGGELGAQIGEAIGKILGAVIGSWLGGGGRPQSGADLAWDAATGEFKVVRVWSKDRGSRKQALAFSNQVTGFLNGVLDASGAKLVNPGAVRLGSYGTYKKDYVYRDGADPVSGDVGRITIRTNDPTVVTTYGTFRALSDMTTQLGGGDIYVKRAIAATVANAGGDPAAHGAAAYGSYSNQTLLGNIIAAHDLAKYLRDPSVINALIETGPESFFSAAWGVSLARAVELGLHRRWSTDWIGGWNLFLDEQADGELDGKGFIASNVQHQLDENGSRLTLMFDGAGNPAAAYGDTLLPGSKSRIVGSAGSDQIEVRFESGWRVPNTAGYQINGTAATGASYVVSVAAIVDGSAGDDVITGGDLGNDLLGGEGGDTLVGGKLDDWLFGGAGNDRLFAGAADHNFAAGDDAGEDAAVGVEGGNGNYLDGG